MNLKFRNFIKATLFLILFTTTSLFAQQLDMKKLKGMKIRSIGPAGMSGRVTAIDVVESSPDIMYVGTASGGVWKSESGGVEWKPVFDEQATLSIGAIAIQQDNPDVIWVGTGEGNPRNSLNGGYGLYKSLDAGKTWKLVGLQETRNIHRIKIDPKNPNTIYVAAIGSPWGEHPERGVFKTTDGGKTWKHILKTNNKSGAADLVMDPSNPNKLIAAMWEHRRKPWTFNSGGKGSGLYITVDGGENWKKLTEEDGLPAGELGRIGIAIAPSYPKRVYALIESKKNALYRSEDGGYTWKKINDKSNQIGNRPFYYSELYVDPVNENRLYTIFTYVNVSEDGGKSFKQLMPAYGTTKGVHPDHHAWWIHPKNPNFMIDGNDGGLNISHDRGRSWRFVENLPIGQFYHINVDNEYPYNIYGGMQDNGSWIGPAYVWKAQGIRNSYWQELAFGDGFDVVPDKDDSRYGFAMSQQGYLVRYDRITGHERLVRPTHPDPEMRLRFNWNAAIAQDPFDNSIVYFGSQFVHKSTNKGHSWEIISPDLTTNNPEKQKQHESGGLTYDATGAENNTTILAISPSPVKKGVIWVGTDDGIVQITKDGGKTWEILSENIKGMPQDGWVVQIKVSNKNAGEAFIVVNNYRNFDFKPYLYHTKDYGKTWESLVNEEQVWNYTLSFVQDPVEPNLMFLGSEGGLYVSIDAGKNWTLWTENYPNVPTMDLVIHQRENDLVIGTFGRSIFVLDDIRPLREIASKGIKSLNDTFDLFTPPIAYLQLNQQPEGTRFAGNAIYNGVNRKSAAMITCLLNKPQKEKNEKTSGEVKPDKKKKKKSGKQNELKKDSVKLKNDTLIFEVYKGNELIRTIKKKAPKDSGIHRFYWGLTENGVHYPSRRKINKNNQKPGGVKVLPGSYKIKLSYNGYIDSSIIQVKMDPRVNVEDDVFKEKYKYLKKVERLQALATKACQRILEAKEIANDFVSKMKKKNAKEFKSQIDSSKALIDSLESLLVPIVGPDNSKKQGIVGTIKPSISSRIMYAKYYMRVSLMKPGETEKRLYQQANNALKSQIEKVNIFFENEWKRYQKEMETIDLSPFKVYKKLE